MDVLVAAVEAAKKNHIPTIVVASTTGDTALKFSEMAKDAGLSLAVVTHDEGRPALERRFSMDARNKIEANGFKVYTHNAGRHLLKKVTNKFLSKLGLPSWQRHLVEVREKYGTGIKVCHIIVKMLKDEKVLQDTKVIAVAGKKQGADSAAIFLIEPKNKWPILEEVIAKGEI